MKTTLTVFTNLLETHRDNPISKSRADTRIFNIDDITNGYTFFCWNVSKNVQ
jgi:hypothetical protein